MDDPINTPRSATGIALDYSDFVKLPATTTVPPLQMDYKDQLPQDTNPAGEEVTQDDSAAQWDQDSASVDW